MDEERAEEVTRWLVKADHDLIAAKALSSLGNEIVDVVCFHAQQCIEKSLKAFLVHTSTPMLKKHMTFYDYSTYALLQIKSLINSKMNRFDLADYAIAGRYPDDGLEITGSDAAQAVKLAEDIMGFVRRKVGAG